MALTAPRSRTVFRACVVNAVRGGEALMGQLVQVTKGALEGEESSTRDIHRRSLVGDAGILVTEIVLISRKSEANQYSWMYLDVGKFGGLIETLDESIKYPIYSEKTGPAQQSILAGPTCDSMDILYEDEKYELPDSLVDGDRLYFFTTGAYTQSYSSVCFNGFPPLRAYVLDEEK